MSETDTPPPPTAPQRNGCLTAFMVIMGIVLLLPGLCALVFAVGSLTAPHYDSGLTPFVVVGLVVAFGGVMLIRSAIRGARW